MERSRRALSIPTLQDRANLGKIEGTRGQDGVSPIPTSRRSWPSGVGFPLHVADLDFSKSTGGTSEWPNGEISPRSTHLCPRWSRKHKENSKKRQRTISSGVPRLSCGGTTCGRKIREPSLSVEGKIYCRPPRWGVRSPSRCGGRQGLEASNARRARDLATHILQKA